MISVKDPSIHSFLCLYIHILSHQDIISHHDVSVHNVRLKNTWNIVFLTIRYECWRWYQNVLRMFWHQTLSYIRNPFLYLSSSKAVKQLINNKKDKSPKELSILVTQQLVPSVSGRTDRKKRLITIGRDPDKTEVTRIIRNFLEFFRILKNFPEFFGILRN